VVLSAGLAVAIASQHSDRQAEHLASIVRRSSRLLQRGEIPGEQAWRRAAAVLWEALQWHLSPQKPGLPHVYHGSPWRSRLQREQSAQVRGLLCDEISEHSQERDLIWGDIDFCYVLWLDFHPKTANWGVCESYGLPPMHFCWHNRWREDLRHVTSQLAKKLHSSQARNALGAREHGCATCLLAMLDHVLPGK